MATYVPNPQFLTTRMVVLLAIIGLHIFIAWAIATGLARKAIEVLAPPIQTEIVQEEQKKVEPPPPPPPELQKPPVEVPPPDVTIDLPVETQTTAISNVTTKHTEAPPPVHTSPATAMVIDKKHFPTSEEYYPPASKRMNEEGTPTVHLCLSADGKLSEGPSVSHSSGSPRLDEGAVNLAKAGARYIKPGTVDGKPVAGCIDFNVKFQMSR